MTEYTGVRIEVSTLILLRTQANEQGRTLSGIINKYLKESATINNVTNVKTTLQNAKGNTTRAPKKKG